jgi:uncharacterized protein YndB with AHSA1/START domain
LEGVGPSVANGLSLPDVVVDGEVIEADPPHKLVQTWRLLFPARSAAEGFTHLTYEIKEVPNSATKLTVTHELAGSPYVARVVSGGYEEEGAGGGWSWVLSGVKSALETGSGLSTSTL